MPNQSKLSIITNKFHDPNPRPEVSSLTAPECKSELARGREASLTFIPEPEGRTKV